MSNQTVVADENAALILEFTTHVDECAFANPSVLSAIRTLLSSFLFNDLKIPVTNKPYSC